MPQGRHRAPTPSLSERASGAARSGAVAALPLLAGSSLLIPGIANAEPPNGWGAIVECESSDRNVENPSPDSSASGYFQFVNSTWRAYGGAEFASRAIGATYAEQEIVANRAYAAEGLRPWAASRDCWQGRVASAPRHALEEVEEPAAVVEEAVPSDEMNDSSTHDDDEHVAIVRAGDALSMIAAAHGTTWQEVFENNRDVVENPDLIYPGERLDI